MKPFFLICMLFISAQLIAQDMPHGTVYGDKPNRIGLIPATNLENFMGKRTRISVTVSGKVLKVTKSKGGWFELDAGKGKVITAHFKKYDINIPASLQGRQVLVQGTAQKQFIADDLQHFAGDTVKGQKQHTTKTNPTKRLTFEVNGLMVEK